MADALLTGRDREEALSRVYVRAVAAYAGYATAECDFDRDGVDLRIHAGGAMRPALDLQLKATVNLAESQDGRYRFPLQRRNYDLLRDETQTPRLLVVLDLPKDEDQWMTITTEELVLRRCAYWLSLKGCAETDNSWSVTVYIPMENVLDVESLRVLMERSRQGGI
jgi:hypothetical protein